ncbi:MAG: DUF6164 family protein [Pseudomonadota bacterium]|nr:DUF6164 family protein [Pseudomonadota bacterium]
MAKRLLNLRNVPADELDDVSALLEQHAIAFYVIEPNMWGVNGGGIWIEDDTQIDRAKEVMGEYQSQRQANARAEYAAAKAAGTVETFESQLRTRPLQVIGAVVGIVIALALLALPYFLLRR